MNVYSGGRVSRVRQALAVASQQLRRVNLFQSVVAGAKAVFAMAVLGVVTPLAPVVVGLVTMAVYTANDLADIEEDSINRPDQSSFVADHPRLIALVAGTGIVGGSGVALWAGGPSTLAVTLVPLVAGVGYSLPVTADGRRLKDICVVNTAVVALAWAVTVTVVPVTLAGRALDAVAAIICLFFFLRSFVSVEVFNVRDMTGDDAAGVDTLPVVVGVGETRQLLAFLDGCSIAAVVALGAVAQTALPALLALPVLCYSLLVTWMVGKTTRLRALCLAKDGEYLLLGLVAVPFL